MNTPRIGEKQPNSTRPRREKPMLDRALQYAKLHNGGKGMKVADMEKKFNENEVTIYKLIRLGEAPRSVISLIKKGEVPATVVANALKASMSPREVVDTVDALVKERHDARHKLHEAGFRGGSSMTLRRAISLAVENLKKKHVIKGEGRKAIIRTFSAILSTTKPSAESIEEAVLMN